MPKLSEITSVQEQQSKTLKLSDILGSEKPSITPVKEERSNLLTNPKETLMRSGGELLGGFFSAIGHPIQTAKAIGSTAIGAVQKIIPGEQGKEQYADSIINFYKDRYGSIEQARKTALEDPFGFASDLSMVLTGVGGLASKAGQVSKLAKLAKAGRLISKTGQVIDPIYAVTTGAGKVLKASTKGKKIAPLASKVDTDILKASAEAGVELPASAVSKSRVAPITESIVGKGLFGDDLIKKVENANVQLNKYADDVIRRTDRASDMSSAGLAISKGADRYRNNWMKIKNELYDKAIIPSKGYKGSEVITVIPEKSIDFITSVLNDKRRASKTLGSASDIQYFSKLKQSLSKKPKLPDSFYGDKLSMYNVPKSEIINTVLKSENKELFVNSLIDRIPNRKYLEQSYDIVRRSQVSARELQSAIRELNNKISNFNDPVTTGNKATLQKLTTLLSEDLDNTLIKKRPELADALNKANEFYSQGLDKLNSSYGEKIFKLSEAGQYDKIVSALINKGTSIEDIPRIFEVIGADKVPDLQAAFIEDLFTKARGKEGKFTPYGITTQINSLGDSKIRAILTPEQYKALKNIETISKSLGKAEKIASGSQTAFIGRILAEVGTLAVNPLQGLKILLGDALFSKFISSKTGQDLLTTGITLTGRTGESIASKAPLMREVGRAIRLSDKSQGE